LSHDLAAPQIPNYITMRSASRSRSAFRWEKSGSEKALKEDEQVQEQLRQFEIQDKNRSTCCFVTARSFLMVTNLLFCLISFALAVSALVYSIKQNWLMNSPFLWILFGLFGVLFFIFASGFRGARKYKSGWLGCVRVSL
jgi:hypothetical protein